MRAILSLPRFRAMAESRMGAENGGSTGDIMRQNGNYSQNESTGIEVQGWDTVYRDQIARIRKGLAQRDKYEEVARVPMPLNFPDIMFPVSTTDLLVGDLYRITGGEQAGTVIRIIDISQYNQSTALHTRGHIVGAPGEWGDWL